jgi:MSHA pilin protein MshA
MKRGFTLIELVMVIIILGILSAVAIPAFVNLQANARTAACQGALGGLRSGVAIWYAKSATSGTAAYPALTDITAVANGVMANGSIPANPYAGASSIIVTTATATTHYTTAGAGWIYSTANGDIWGATTDSSTY